MKIIQLALLLSTTIPLCQTAGAQQSPVLTLQDCIKLARQQGPEHLRDRWDLDRSHYNLNQARAPFEPNANLDLTLPTYNESNRSVEDPSFINRVRLEDIDFRYRGALNVSQRVPHIGNFSIEADAERRNFISNRQADFVDYRGDMTFRYNRQIFTEPREEINLKSAELNFANARSRFHRRELDLENRIVQAYYNLVQSVRQLTIEEQRRKQSKASFDQAQRKFEIGLIAETEALSLKVALLEADAQYDRAATNIERQRDRLRDLLGMNPVEALEVDTEVDDTRYNIDKSRAIAAALRHRLDLHEADITEEISELNLKSTKQNNGLRATVNASVGLRGQGDEIEEVSSTFERNLWNVNVQVQMPLIDGGDRRAQIGQARIDLERSKHDRKNLRRTITLDVRDALRNLSEAERQIELNRERLEVAERNYSLESSRFDLGIADSQNLLDAQASLTSASINALDAVITYQLQLMGLRLATMADLNDLVEK